MMSTWLSRHRPLRRRNTIDKTGPDVPKKTSQPFERLSFRPKRRGSGDSDITLVELVAPDNSNGKKVCDEVDTCATTARCSSPLPLEEFHDGNLSNASKSTWNKWSLATTHTITSILQTAVTLGEATNLPYLKGFAGIILLISNSVQVRDIICSLLAVSYMRCPQATAQNQEDSLRMSKMLLQLASTASEYLQSSPDGQSSFAIQNLAG